MGAGGRRPSGDVLPPPQSGPLEGISVSAFRMASR